jgi:hypothetical protein
LQWYVYINKNRTHFNVKPSSKGTNVMRGRIINLMDPNMVLMIVILGRKQQHLKNNSKMSEQKSVLSIDFDDCDYE